MSKQQLNVDFQSIDKWKWRIYMKSLVAQRLICDHINSAGGIHKVDVSNQLLVSSVSARQRYMANLEEQKITKEKERCA